MIHLQVLNDITFSNQYTCISTAFLPEIVSEGQDLGCDLHGSVLRLQAPVEVGVLPPRWPGPHGGCKQASVLAGCGLEVSFFHFLDLSID